MQVAFSPVLLPPLGCTLLLLPVLFFLKRFPGLCYVPARDLTVCSMVLLERQRLLKHGFPG